MKQAFVAWLVASLMASCAKLGTFGAGPTPGPPREIWSGTSAGVHIVWTTDEIRAERLTSPSAPVFSEVGATIEDFHRYAAARRADCDMARSAHIQSVVGPILSILEQDTLRCADGSDVSRRTVRVVDLGRAGGTASLSDYIAPAALGPLRLRLTRVCRAVPPDALDHFWFESAGGAIVTIGVALSGACATQQLTYALPIPRALLAPLKQAAARTDGFLGRDRGRISQGLSTVVNYHYRTSG